jgi:hypothetical protein
VVTVIADTAKIDNVRAHRLEKRLAGRPSVVKESPFDGRSFAAIKKWVLRQVLTPRRTIANISCYA